MSELYDITPLISPRLKVWPGDTVPTREIILDLDNGDSVTLSTLHATVHLGAHADAPSHYGLGAPAIHAQGLDPYLGPCQVITVNVDMGARVSLSDLPVTVTAERVLIHTDSYPDPTLWNSDFAALDPELVRSLAGQGVKLIGIDTPSVDLSDCKDLRSHRAFLDTGTAILEGVTLVDVPDGEYELIALPLRLEGFDGSPVRAVLRRS